MQINYFKSCIQSSAFRAGDEPVRVCRAVDSLAVVLSALGKKEVMYVKKCCEK